MTTTDRLVRNVMNAIARDMEDAVEAALGHGLRLDDLRIRLLPSMGGRELVDARSGEVLYRQGRMHVEVTDRMVLVYT